MKFDFGQSNGLSSYFCHYAVHYADSRHQVLPVTEGYRLALVYSVSWPIDRDQCIPTLKPVDENLAAPIAEALEYWLHWSNEPLFFPMEHSYTEKSLQFVGDHFLKGSDRDRFALLKKANEMLPLDKQFTFTLALAEVIMLYYNIQTFGSTSGEASRQPTWPLDAEVENQAETSQWYRDCDTDDCSLNISVLYEVDTGILHETQEKNIRICDILDQIVNPYNWELSTSWGYPFFYEIEGYLGNEGECAKETYHRCILLAWPKASDFKMLPVFGSPEMIVDRAKLLSIKQKSEILSEARATKDKNIIERTALSLAPLDNLANMNDQDFCNEALKTYAKTHYFGYWHQDLSERLNQLVNLLSVFPWHETRDAFMEVTKSLNDEKFLWIVSKILSSTVVDKEAVAEDLLETHLEQTPRLWDFVVSQYHTIEKEEGNIEAVVKSLLKVTPSDSMNEVSNAISSNTKKWKTVPQCLLDIINKRTSSLP
jgi:hypothetical protein